jgi:hypothetical protein
MMDCGRILDHDHVLALLTDVAKFRNRLAGVGEQPVVQPVQTVILRFVVRPMPAPAQK